MGLMTPQMVDEALEMLASGKSTRFIAKQQDVGQATVIRALLERDASDGAYARARQIRAAMDEQGMQQVINQVKAGKLAPDAARVVLGGMQWLAERRDAKRYGNKLDLNHGAQESLERMIQRAREPDSN